MNLVPEIVPINPDHQNTDFEPFRCNICSKTFGKRQSRNRHVLYCRKKLGDNVPVVRKSCESCRRAKVKCSSDFPQCCRCVDKHLLCEYKLTRRNGNLAPRPASPPSTETMSADAILFQRVGGQDDILRDVTLSSDNQALLHSSVDHPGALAIGSELLYQDPLFQSERDARGVEELQDSDVGANLCSISTADEFLLDFSLGLAPVLTVDPTISLPANCMFHTPYLVLRPIDSHYEVDFDNETSRRTSLLAPRSPFTHSHLSNGSPIGRTFLLQNIQSYATLLGTSILPPFIHPVSLPLQGPSLVFSGPLEICKSIIGLYANKTTATGLFLWRSITMEKDRFLEGLEDADEWTTLSMLQSITLYLLLRIFDQDSLSFDFDHELIRAMTKIAIKAEQWPFLCAAEVEGGRPNWKEWVLLESKRRTVTLLFLLFLLFDIKPEQRAKTHVGLSVLPLPAQKQLWEAGGEEEWKQNYDEMLKTRKGNSYLRYEDLRDLGKGKVTGRRMEDLSMWMVSGDAFGILVMMAATIL